MGRQHAPRRPARAGRHRRGRVPTDQRSRRPRGRGPRPGGRGRDPERRPPSGGPDLPDRRRRVRRADARHRRRQRLPVDPTHPRHRARRAVGRRPGALVLHRRCLGRAGRCAGPSRAVSPGRGGADLRQAPRSDDGDDVRSGPARATGHRAPGQRGRGRYPASGDRRAHCGPCSSRSSTCAMDSRAATRA